ncbi:MAG TPA: hypothetical protein EYP65_00575 [Armatimonadetes bacterium]|nr:hypothetical protein [Armatimonadota bacterium]
MDAKAEEDRYHQETTTCPDGDGAPEREGLFEGPIAVIVWGVMECGARVKVSGREVGVEMVDSQLQQGWTREEEFSSRWRRWRRSGGSREGSR